MKKKKMKGDEVVFISPKTCGIYKDGGTRFKPDTLTGKRTKEIDNELQEYVDRFLSGEDFEGLTRKRVKDIFERQILVPRYFDARWEVDFQNLVDANGLNPITLGKLQESNVISVRGGHGSPGNDQRFGHIPYVKVSDIRSLRININPTNLVSQKVAENFWGGPTSGLKAWDLITPNRASSNIGEFAMLLPGEENIVLTKEVFVIRVQEGNADGWDPFYLLWAFCLKAVRKQWQRVALMQTNREDVGSRYKEIVLPLPTNKEWAEQVSKPFRDFFTTLAKAKESFIDSIRVSGHEFIASVTSSSFETIIEQQEEDGSRKSKEEDNQAKME